jgi:phytoene synthase
VRRFGLVKADFLAVIDGMEMDIGAPIVAPDFAALDLYCDRVASAVGRLSVRIFGMESEPGAALAHHLGRALQFTNILRDLDEDAAVGRLYLPAEALDAAGITAREPAAVLADPQLDRACRWLAAKALEHYHAADKIIGAHPKGRLRAPRLMIGVYRHILKRMIRASWKTPRHRISVGKGRLAWVVLTRGIPK